MRANLSRVQKEAVILTAAASAANTNRLEAALQNQVS
jgi:hypothetical protein